MILLYVCGGGVYWLADENTHTQTNTSNTSLLLAISSYIFWVNSDSKLKFHLIIFGFNLLWAPNKMFACIVLQIEIKTRKTRIIA